MCLTPRVVYTVSKFCPLFFSLGVRNSSITSGLSLRKKREMLECVSSIFPDDRRKLFNLRLKLYQSGYTDAKRGSNLTSYKRSKC